MSAVVKDQKAKVEAQAVEVKPQPVTLTIDGVEVSVDPGTVVIRAAEQAGIAIPRFCDHPLLDPIGACRQCMVDVPDAGNGRGMPKPQASCTLAVAPGMVVQTQQISDKVKKTQQGIMELLLINHPLDCPICDKGGECPLQNQAMSAGQGETRYTDGEKRTYPKPMELSPAVLLDRERCVLCSRCTRFSDQISGDRMINLVERGALQQVGIYPDEPYDSYFSGNVIQICPVGALTSKDYRFSARPFDLVSTTTTCEGCAAGCELRVDHRHYQVKRRNAGCDMAVNEEWNCDRGRFGFWSNRGDDRVTTPLVRRDGKLVEASWPEAFDAAVAGLKEAGSSVGVLTGGQLTYETALAYSRFARTVVGTNSVDFRARAISAEEENFLSAKVAGRRFEDSVTYADLEKAKKVVLVGFEPEDESPIVFLRLRKAVRKHGLQITTIAPFASRGSQKLQATVVATKPGGEAQALRGLRDLGADTIILAGERLATVPGGLTAVVEIADRTGARWAWIPRRAGEMAALEAGLLPGLLPGGRPSDNDEARQEMARLWDGTVADEPGLALDAQLEAARQGDLKAFITAGFEAADLPDSAGAIEAVKKVFTISLEHRLSDVAKAADVVFPIDLLEETAGTFIDWEHRARPVRRVIDHRRAAMSEIRVLSILAKAMGSDWGDTTDAASTDQIKAWTGQPVAFTPVAAGRPAGGLAVGSWRELLDDSRMLDGADSLHATARPIQAHMSATTAANYGVDKASEIKLIGPKGSRHFPLVIDSTVAEDTVWVPARSEDMSLNVAGIASGDTVDIATGDPRPAPEGDR